MKKKLQVFISSTYKDLVDERAETTISVLKSGNIPVGMELFSPTGAQKTIIEETLNESDVYCLILGARYGSKTDGVSYTEWEFNKAVEKKLPIFAFELSKDYVKNKMSNEELSPDDIEYGSPDFQQFKKAVKAQHIVSEINNLSEINGVVQQSISQFEQKLGDNLVGWVRGTILNTIEDNDNRIISLKKDNSSNLNQIEALKQKITTLRAGQDAEPSFITKGLDDFVQRKISNDNFVEPVKNAINFITDYFGQVTADLKAKYHDERNLIRHGTSQTFDSGSFNIGRDFVMINADYDSGKLTVQLYLAEQQSQIDTLTLTEDAQFKSSEYDGYLSKNLLDKYISRLTEPAQQ